MEKFSLFDFLVFLIPGGTALAVVIWMLYSLSPDCIATENSPDALLLFIALMPAYVLGHLLNYWGTKIEQIRTGSKIHWVTAIEKDMDLAIKLNALCEILFGFAFIDANNNIDVQKSGKFYDLAYSTLEIKGLLEKIRILYAQFKFLYNSVALAVMCVIAAIIVLLHDFFSGASFLHPFYLETSSLQAIVLIIVSLLLGYGAYSLAPRRRELKMTNTLNCFYVLTTLK